jgi:hypothetical protein
LPALASAITPSAWAARLGACALHKVGLILATRSATRAGSNPRRRQWWWDKAWLWCRRGDLSDESRAITHSTSRQLTRLTRSARSRSSSLIGRRRARVQIPIIGNGGGIKPGCGAEGGNGFK